MLKNLWKKTKAGVNNIGGKIKNFVYGIAQKACRYKYPLSRPGFSGERHVPCYNYCGPGTHFAARQARGDKGVNQLDTCCIAHDRAYNDKNPTPASIRQADKKLQACAKRLSNDKKYNKSYPAVLRKVFQAKSFLEDAGYLDPATFATHLKKVRGK